MRKSKRESTAYHEAGHAVAAWSLGLKVRKATIVPADDHLELAVHDSPLRGISSSMGVSTVGASFRFRQRNLQNRTGFALRFVFVLHPIPF